MANILSDLNCLIKIIEDVEHTPKYDKVGYVLPILGEEQELERVKKIINPQLAYIEKEIDYLFLVVIKNCKNVEEAQEYFDTLQRIQAIIGGLFFQGQIDVSKKLDNFIRECDRLDDPWLRQYIFNNLKQNDYFLES